MPTLSSNVDFIDAMVPPLFFYSIRQVEEFGKGLKNKMDCVKAEVVALLFRARHYYFFIWELLSI